MKKDTLLRLAVRFTTALFMFSSHTLAAAEVSGGDAGTTMNDFTGLQPGLGTLPLLGRGRTRSISAENPTGEKGKGGMAIPDPKELKAADAARAADDLGQGWKVRPFIRLNAGETKTLMDVDGPGIIQHIWLVEGLNRGLVIRFYWDGEATPSVEVPAPDFFAVGHGKFAPVNSAVVVVNPKNALNCYWPMPFRKHARITLSNDTDKDVNLIAYQITYVETDVPPAAGYFHAQYRRASTAEKNPYVILDGVKGHGRYVGTFLAYTQMEPGWFGEGEIKFFMDGDDKFPTICGTGTEDYFLGSYGFPQTFSTAYSGTVLPAKENNPPPNFWSCYRWHILDPINFDADLRVTIQALGWQSGGKYKKLSDDISSVAYWYQAEPHAAFPKFPHLASVSVRASPFASVPSAIESRPNVVFILMDDLGKEWIHCYGAEGIETPNIDRLAATGMKFNTAYSMPQCTPSRMVLMTGQYPFRNGWVNHWDVPRWGVGYYDWRTNPGMGRVMRAVGYKTAAAGKWQLNDFRVQPDAMIQHGFDEYCMWTGGEGDSKNPAHAAISENRYWDPYIHTKDGSKTYKGQFGPDIYNQFLLDFIARNKDHPFFVYYPMCLAHLPLTTTPLEPKAVGKYGQMKAMVRYADYLIGKVMKHLDDLGIRDKTLIVFTTDNGTAGEFVNLLNGREVQGGKMKTTENGVCEPFIANWPGKISSGIVSDALIDFVDLLPTFADFAGGKPEPGYVYDGFSAKDVFLGRAKKTSHDWILAMGSRPGLATTNGIENVYGFRDRVIRQARCKLFIGSDRKPEELVDVIKDPEEKTNLINDTEYQPELEQMVKVMSTMQPRDNNPCYTRIPDYPRYVPLSQTGQSRIPEKKGKGAGMTGD